MSLPRLLLHTLFLFSHGALSLHIHRHPRHQHGRQLAVPVVVPSDASAQTSASLAPITAGDAAISDIQSIEQGLSHLAVDLLSFVQTVERRLEEMQAILEGLTSGVDITTTALPPSPPLQLPTQETSSFNILVNTLFSTGTPSPVTYPFSTTLPTVLLLTSSITATRTSRLTATRTRTITVVRPTFEVGPAMAWSKVTANSTFFRSTSSLLSAVPTLTYAGSLALTQPVTQSLQEQPMGPVSTLLTSVRQVKV